MLMFNSSSSTSKTLVTTILSQELCFSSNHKYQYIPKQFTVNPNQIPKTIFKRTITISSNFKSNRECSPTKTLLMPKCRLKNRVFSLETSHMWQLTTN